MLIWPVTSWHQNPIKAVRNACAFSEHFILFLFQCDSCSLHWVCCAGFLCYKTRNDDHAMYRRFSETLTIMQHKQMVFKPQPVSPPLLTSPQGKTKGKTSNAVSRLHHPCPSVRSSYLNLLFTELTLNWSSLLSLS